MRGVIHCIERNIHGAWVIYGALGVRQYYYYTKKQAVDLYRQECRNKIRSEERRVGKEC